jgi:ABC-2 type transport system permease protein
VAIGLIIASNATSIEGFQVIMNFLAMPLFFLSGALFPLDTAPSWLSLLSRIDPLTYAVDGMRASMNGIHVFGIGIDMLAVFLFAAIFVTIAELMFKNINR